MHYQGVSSGIWCYESIVPLAIRKIARIPYHRVPLYFVKDFVATLARFCSFGANPYMLYCRCSKAYKTESCCEQTSGSGVCFLHREKKRRSIFEHIQYLTAASAAEEKSGALALCRMARRQYPASSDPVSFGHDDLGKGDGDYEGRLSANSSHLHNRRYRHRVRRSFDDEFLPQRQNGRGIACMAQTHRNHLGDPEWSRLYYGLRHAVLLRRSVDGIKHGDS